MKKKLIYVNGQDEDERFLGNVLDHDSSGYILRRYSNDYGKDFSEIVKTISLNQTSEIIGQDNLAARVKKLCSFFEDEKPEYISGEVIYLLNLENEDIFASLAGIVKFPY